MSTFLFLTFFPHILNQWMRLIIIFFCIWFLNSYVIGKKIIMQWMNVLLIFTKKNLFSFSSFCENIQVILIIWIIVFIYIHYLHWVSVQSNRSWYNYYRPNFIYFMFMVKWSWTKVFTKCSTIIPKQIQVIMVIFEPFYSIFLRCSQMCKTLHLFLWFQGISGTVAPLF